MTRPGIQYLWVSFHFNVISRMIRCFQFEWCECNSCWFHLSVSLVPLRSFQYFPVNSQVGHFTGAGGSLDDRSLLLTCWLYHPGIPGRDTRLFIGTVFTLRGQCGRYSSSRKVLRGRACVWELGHLAALSQGYRKRHKFGLWLLVRPPWELFGC